MAKAMYLFLFHPFHLFSVLFVSLDLFRLLDSLVFFSYEKEVKGLEAELQQGTDQQRDGNANGQISMRIHTLFGRVGDRAKSSARVSLHDMLGSYEGEGAGGRPENRGTSLTFWLPDMLSTGPTPYLNQGLKSLGAPRGKTGDRFSGCT